MPPPLPPFTHTFTPIYLYTNNFYREELNHQNFTLKLLNDGHGHSSGGNSHSHTKRQPAASQYSGVFIPEVKKAEAVLFFYLYSAGYLISIHFNFVVVIAVTAVDIIIIVIIIIINIISIIINIISIIVYCYHYYYSILGGVGGIKATPEIPETIHVISVMQL